MGLRKKQSETNERLKIFSISLEMELKLDNFLYFLILLYIRVSSELTREVASMKWRLDRCVLGKRMISGHEYLKAQQDELFKAVLSFVRRQA